VPQAYNYKHLNATGVSTISLSNFGMLHGIVLNQQNTTPGTTVTAQVATVNLMTIYDGTTTAASTATNIIGICQLSNAGIGEYIYDALYANGLTIQIGGSVSPVDITVSYT
jgi:hypothetical protein